MVTFFEATAAVKLINLLRADYRHRTGKDEALIEQEHLNRFSLSLLASLHTTKVQ